MSQTDSAQSSSLQGLSSKTREKFSRVLENIKHITNHEVRSGDVKIENFIGFTRVPTGLAGPLWIKDPDGVQRETYAPMATTEAALIASACRGCKVLNQSGGVQYHVLGDGMSRAPVFRFASPEDAIAFIRKVPRLQDDITQVAESTSRRVRLQRLTPSIIGSEVHLHFEYTCGDATGQNMVTIATQKACEWLMEPAQCKDPHIIEFQIEGNVSSDKKASWRSVHVARGVQVTAWGSITDETCQRIFGCTAERLYITHQRIVAGGIRIGMHGNNVNTANVLAAIFIAAGQDAASVAEASWSHTVIEYDSSTHQLNASVHFPSLPVGVVGGGTSYPTQHEALEIMQCTGEGKKYRLAGVIASFALALDLSTVAAIGNNTFSNSHQLLARGPQGPVSHESKL